MPFLFCYLVLLVITFEDAVNQLPVHLRCEEADEGNDNEAAHHRDGTAVDGVDGIADEHVDNRQSDTPCEASPYRSSCHTTPIQT